MSEQLNAWLNARSFDKYYVLLRGKKVKLACSNGVLVTFAAFWGGGFDGITPEKLSDFLLKHCTVSLCGQVYFCDTQGTKFFVLPLPLKLGWKMLVTESELNEIVTCIFNNFRNSPEVITSLVSGFASSVGRAGAGDKKAHKELVGKILEILKEEDVKFRSAFLGFDGQVFVGSDSAIEKDED